MFSEMDAPMDIEAVIDKDLASSRLARDLGVNLFLILTDVKHVKLHFGLPGERDLTSATVDQTKTYLKDGHFGLGSLAPKIQAAIEFVRDTENRSIITSLDGMLDAVAGKDGTTITP
ncbi:MAG: hypothetical protein AB1445_01690 [Bacillota bacterium]